MDGLAAGGPSLWRHGPRGHVRMCPSSILDCTMDDDVGDSGIEPLTSAMSRRRSNQLSQSPRLFCIIGSAVPTCQAPPSWLLILAASLGPMPGTAAISSAEAR